MLKKPRCCFPAGGGGEGCAHNTPGQGTERCFWGLGIPLGRQEVTELAVGDPAPNRGAEMGGRWLCPPSHAGLGGWGPWSGWSLSPDPQSLPGLFMVLAACSPSLLASICHAGGLVLRDPRHILPPSMCQSRSRLCLERMRGPRAWGLAPAPLTVPTGGQGWDAIPSVTSGHGQPSRALCHCPLAVGVVFILSAS